MHYLSLMQNNAIRVTIQRKSRVTIQIPTCLPQVTVQISIDKQLRVSPLLIVQNLKTKILLFTSEIFKTNSLSFLKNNSKFVSLLKNTRQFIWTKSCAILHGQMIKNVCVHNLWVNRTHSSSEILLLLLAIRRNSN